jgi:hypothetical protein
MFALKFAERRARRRYAIQLDLRCKLTASGEVLDGTTCDISSYGVRFRLDRSLGNGERVELSLNWPIRLEDRCPLQLVLHGFVTRNNARETAMAVTRYEFRLLRVRAPCGIMN